MNHVIEFGRLTRQPDLRHTSTGKAICEFSIAVTGYSKDVSHFFDCIAWGLTAEAVAKYFKKGQRILVEGQLIQERWEKDGKNYSKIKILVNRFEFIEKKEESNGPEYKTDYQNEHNSNYDDNVPY